MCGSTLCKTYYNGCQGATFNVSHVYCVVIFIHVYMNSMRGCTRYFVGALSQIRHFVD